MTSFVFSRTGLTGRERILERTFEILPGLTSWTILLGMIVLGFLKPLVAAVFVIAIDFYWLLRLFYLTIFLILSYLRLAIERQTDWMQRVHHVDRPEASPIPLSGGTLPQRFSLAIHSRELSALRQSPSTPPVSDELYHLVIIPVVKEDATIIEPGIQSLAQQTFPTKQILVVLAVEERAQLSVKEGARRLQQRYRQAFLDFLVVVHPDGLPGEAPVKGANATYAAKAADAYFDSRGITHDHVIASCFDADTVVSPQYMACLTYHFLITPDRTRASFQPIPVYHNNIWEAPGFARVLDIGASFFQLIEATNPEKLVTFSSHSMSFKALVEVGYWPVDMISDDSAIFWKAFLYYHGRYRTVPMYVTVSMDVVAADAWWKTAMNVYRQKRRWAWGVENFPLVMRGFLQDAGISLYDKIRLAFKLFEGHVGWATWAFLLTIIGWIPAVFAGREFSSSVLYYSAPRITATIFHLASVSLVTTIILSLLFLPRPPVKRPLLKSVGLTLEWLLVPLAVTCFSALPALDAQTRLMLGWPLDFWVTEKRRRPFDPSTQLRVESRAGVEGRRGTHQRPTVRSMVRHETPPRKPATIASGK